MMEAEAEVEAEAETEAASGPSQSHHPSLREFVGYFLRLGSLGFGGPIVLTAAMCRDLVDRLGWVTPTSYEKGLALAQLAPGPLAAQLAIYLGWAHSGVVGATAVGLAFVLPSFFLVLGLAAVYVHFQGLPWLQGMFYGVGAAVIALMVQGAIKLWRKTVKRDWLYAVIAGVSGLVTAVTESEMALLFLGAGIVTLLLRARWTPGGSSGGVPGNLAIAALPPLPDWLFAGMGRVATSEQLLGQILLYFTEAGAFVFGSGLAIVPFLHSGVVSEFGWLNDREFLDAVAVAMITPGPVVITVAFIGFLVAGVAGATLAAVGVFLPCYLLVVLPAPYYDRIADRPALKHFIGGVTAAAVGAIAGATVVLGKRAIVDVTTTAMFLGALAIVNLPRKIPEPLLIALAAGVGILVAG